MPLRKLMLGADEGAGEGPFGFAQGGPSPHL
jgi:hypothetical protein